MRKANQSITHTKHKWLPEEDEELSKYMKEKQTPSWIQENIFPKLTVSAIRNRITHIKTHHKKHQTTGEPETKKLKEDRSKFHSFYILYLICELIMISSQYPLKSITSIYNCSKKFSRYQ